MSRVVYNKADLYLLDDPLSAVDAVVSQHIFDKVIGPNGLLSHTTRIVSMNSTKYLPQCDLIVVVQDGEIFQCGTYEELVGSNRNLQLLGSNWPIEIKEGNGEIEEVTEQKSTKEESTKNNEEPVIEKKKKGQVWSLLFYIKTCGIFLIAGHIFFSSIAISILKAISSLFMANWTEQSKLNQTISTESMHNQQWNNFLVYSSLEISVGKFYLQKF